MHIKTLHMSQAVSQRFLTGQPQWRKKRAVVENQALSHGLQRGNIIGLDGISILDGK
ncbi:MAG: hypothetical protein ACLTW9_18250 [Enterocloster sp.]